jgi:hypothetical protein
VRGHGDFLTGNGTEQLGRFGAALGCLTTYPHPTGDRANQISNANCDGTAWPDRERFGRQVFLWFRCPTQEDRQEFADQL